MNWLKKLIGNLSIKQKLIFLSMSTSTIATIISCAGFLIFNKISERSDLVDEMRLVSRIFAEELSESIVKGDKETVTKSLKLLKNRESLIQTCIYVNDKEEAFVEFIRDVMRGKPCSAIEKVKGRYEFRSDKTAGEHLIVASYITHINQKVGYVVMVSNLDRAFERMNRGIMNSGILFIFILLSSYFISRFLQKTISQPILHLADVSYVVRGGNYHIRAKHYSDDELGILTDAYNNMLREIQSSRENLEEKVMERTQDLEKVMQVKTEFLSNMSHEIRTPIHGIMNYVDFLVHDWDLIDKDQKYAFIMKLHNNSNRLLSLINNLLDLSKLDAGKMEFLKNRANLIELVESLIQECEALYLQNDDIKIEFHYDKKNSFFAYCDYHRITQVIRNLLSNAIKFTAKGKIIALLEKTELKKENEAPQAAIKFTLIDQGVGIPRKELEFIFDKFNQSAKTKTGAGGTGLGLTICKEIIIAHQGLIWAENNHDKLGARFIFVIPVNQQII